MNNCFVWNKINKDNQMLLNYTDQLNVSLCTVLNAIEWDLIVNCMHLYLISFLVVKVYRLVVKVQFYVGTDFLYCKFMSHYEQ